MEQLENFRDYHINELKNLEYAKVYLETAIEEYHKDGDKEAFFLALRDIAEAQGEMTKHSKKTNINRQRLYNPLSEQSNPTLDTLDNALHSLGFRISVEPLSK